MKENLRVFSTTNFADDFIVLLVAVGHTKKTISFISPDQLNLQLQPWARSLIIAWASIQNAPPIHNERLVVPVFAGAMHIYVRIDPCTTHPCVSNPFPSIEENFVYEILILIQLGTFQHFPKMAAAVSFAPADGLSIQNVETLDPSKLTPLTPEVISRQVK